MAIKEEMINYISNNNYCLYDEKSITFLKIEIILTIYSNELNRKLTE